MHDLKCSANKFTFQLYIFFGSQTSIIWLVIGKKSDYLLNNKICKIICSTKIVGAESVLILQLQNFSCTSLNYITRDLRWNWFYIYILSRILPRFGILNIKNLK